MTVYTLFGQTGGGTIASDSTSYTMGMQFTLSQSATLTGIWFYSASGALSLPAGCAVFQQTGAGTGTVVSGSRNDTPSWSGAAGSGWVKCAYASGPTLAASTVYKVVIEKDTSNQVYSITSHYWDTGAGASGLTSGIITAPNNAGGDGGQDTFITGSPWPAYPASSFNASNYWIDVEVTTSGGAAHTDTAALTVTPGRTDTQVHGHNPAAALTVAPGRANVAAYGKNPKLVLGPVFAAVPSGGSKRKGGIDRHRWWKP